MTVKQALLETAAALADDASWDDAMAQLELRRKIAESQAAFERGQWVVNEEVLAEIDAWLESEPSAPSPPASSSRHTAR